MIGCSFSVSALRKNIASFTRSRLFNDSGAKRKKIKYSVTSALLIHFELRRNKSKKEKILTRKIDGRATREDERR